MCAQCMAGAAAAVSGATGLRVWLASRRPSWLTERGLQRVTVALALSAILVAGALGSNGA
jgi:hypothetical protein